MNIDHSNKILQNKQLFFIYFLVLYHVLLSLAMIADHLSQSSLFRSVKISINDATVEEIQAIPGVGLLRAKKIVAYRTSFGFFVEVEDLKNIEGIGSHLIRQMKSFCVIDKTITGIK